MTHTSKRMKALIRSLVLLLVFCSVVAVASGASWTEIGIGNPITDKDGNLGYVYSVTFADKDQLNLLTGIVCPLGTVRSDVACRPATSTDQGVSWSVHDSPHFDQIETKDWGNWGARIVARSAANPNRMWFAANGHPWLSPEPKGGLWRSDNNGTSWTENLMAGQPGESGEINVVIPDPDDQDKVFIGRGYDFGNVSVSTDAGVTFIILQGHNNVAKTGIDEWSLANITIDFVAELLINKHHFGPPVSMNLDGSNSTQINFPGVDDEDGRPVGGITSDVPVRGLQKRAGGKLGRYTANGGFIYYPYGWGGPQPLYYAAGGAPDVSSAVLINGVTIDFPDEDRANNLLAHPTEPCTWVVQTGGTTFSLTRDCGAIWLPLPMNGFTGITRVLAVVYFPDASGNILAFTEDGRRFRFSQTSALPVSIDIKPGSFPDSINPRGEGVIPVAILTTTTFDATTVDPMSVQFGPDGATEAHGRGHRKDVNGDGKKDLVLHFRTQDTGIVCGDTSASLTGETFRGKAIEGSDSIRTVGCKCKPHRPHRGGLG